MNRMGLGQRLLGPLCAAIFAVLSSLAIAQDAADVRVNLNLKDADMMTAVRTLTLKTGVSFVVLPSKEPFGRITLKLDDATVEDALRFITQSAGAFFRRDENGVYIISRDKPMAPVEAPLPTAQRTRFTRRIKLMKADGQNVYDQIVYARAFSAQKTFEDLKRFANIGLSDVTRVFGPSLSQGGGIITNDRVFHPSPVTDVTPRMTTPLTGSETGSDIALPGESAGQLGGGGGFGGGFGGGQGGFGGGVGGFGGGQGGLGGGQGGLGGGLGQVGAGGAQLVGGTGLVPEGIDFISFDPTDNSFIVRGTEEAIAELQRNILLFDVTPRQVEVVVEFVTTGQTINRELGYQWTYQRGAFVTGFQPSVPAGPGSVFLSYSTGNIASRLRAILLESTSTSVTAPRIRTLNNTPAVVSSFVVANFVTTQSFLSNGTVSTFETAFQIPVTTQLVVSPRINEGDNTITMGLAPSVQDISDVTVTPRGSVLPNQRGQFINVVARVGNGETIALAGFNTKSNSTNVTRVPVLSELPVIGQFFRSTLRRQTSSELIIFVTPRIIEDTGPLTIGP